METPPLHGVSVWKGVLPPPPPLTNDQPIRAQNSTLLCNESFWSNARHWMQKYTLSTPNTRLVYWTCTVPLFKNSYTPRTVHDQYTNGASGVPGVYARIACPGIRTTKPATGSGGCRVRKQCTEQPTRHEKKRLSANDTPANISMPKRKTVLVESTDQCGREMISIPVSDLKRHAATKRPSNIRDETLLVCQWRQRC